MSNFLNDIKSKIPTLRKMGIDDMRYHQGRKEKVEGAVTMAKLMKSFQRDRDEYGKACALVPLTYIDDLVTKLEDIDRTL